MENGKVCGLVPFTSVYGPPNVVAFCKVPVKVIVIPVADRVTLIVGVNTMTNNFAGALVIDPAELLTDTV